jgi:hypothetical protein
MTKEDTAKAEAQAASRKAYGDAMAKLREAHRAEFETLLDREYVVQGMESPAMKRAAREKAAAEAKVARAEAKEARRLAKIAQMEADLAALKGEQLPLIEG